MILVDVNLLVDATMTAARDHHAARSWLQDHLSETARVGLPWAAITGFVRVAGQPRAWERPLPIGEALAIVGSWFSRPCAWTPEPGPRHLELLERLLSAQPSARLVTDAHSSRREDEQRHVAATLTELEATIRREAFGEDGAQESLFANIELEGDRRQVERDREALRARLDASPARSRRSSRPSSDATRTLVTGSSRRRSRCWSPKACGSESRQERLARRSLISSMRCSGSVGDSTNPNRP